MNGLAELEAYYARKTADEYAAITLDDDGYARRSQIDGENATIKNFQRQDINTTKTAADKAVAKQNRNTSHSDYTAYLESLINLQTTYETAVADADEAYYTTRTTAEAAFDETVSTAEETFDNDYCRLTGQYYDAMLIIDHGGTIEEEYFENGTSSLNVQVCFPAGTPVILADGSTKNIEEIQVGEMVKCVAHQTPMGEVSTGCVVRVFKNAPQSLWRLNFGIFEIRATKEHPFYVKSKGWVAAENLQIGDVCRGADNGDVVLVAKAFEAEEVPVFNFEVEEKHTYFVGKNTTESVLVHNECPLWFSGVMYGYSRVGQNLWYPIRATGITQLIGIENSLQKSDRSVEFMREQLWPVSNHLESATDIVANTAVGCIYLAGGLSAASSLGISEIGNASSLQSAYHIGYNELTVAGATGTLFPATYLRNPSGISSIEVSRWGSEGLKPGDWVMPGRKSYLNYALSGKYQPGVGNQFASYGSGSTYVVPSYTIRCPSGYGIDGHIKRLFNQHIYDPSLPVPSVPQFQGETILWIESSIIFADRGIITTPSNGGMQ